MQVRDKSQSSNHSGSRGDGGEGRRTERAEKFGGSSRESRQVPTGTIPIAPKCVRSRQKGSHAPTLCELEGAAIIPIYLSADTGVP